MVVGCAAAISDAVATCHTESQQSSRATSLRIGVKAVVDAMAGEMQFVNGSEDAFALFRRGCRHCAQAPVELASVAQKETIVAFLSRVAARKSSWRQLRELASILIQVTSWRDQLATAPLPLLEVLAEAAAVHSALMDAKQEAWVASAAKAPIPTHEARIFLREVKTARYLSIAQGDKGQERCIATELAASLFVCNCRWSAAQPQQEIELATCVDPCPDGEDAQDEEDVEEEEDDLPKRTDSLEPESGADKPVGAILGFAHEGIPSLGCYLACRRKRGRRIREVVTRWGEKEVCCSSRRFGRFEEFRWYTDATVQHVRTGLWLTIDSADPSVVALDKTQRSYWEALPAL